LLLVHPDLKDDPVQKQGEIGFITAAILNTDEFYVGFDDHQVGFYGADALLTFKEPGDIYDYMHQHALTLSVDDFKDLKNIASISFPSMISFKKVKDTKLVLLKRL
jgi:hypothetical protein